MKKIFIASLLTIALWLLASCQPAVFFVTITPPPQKETVSPTCQWPCTAPDKQTAVSLLATAANMAGVLTAGSVSETPTPVCQVWPCPGDSLTLTAAASRTLLSPSSTPPANITLIPFVGDLGWGAVYGRFTDSITGKPVSNARISCEHFSYTSPQNVRCYGVTWTNDDGIYSFVPVFFHDSDVITLRVDAPGYRQFEFRNSFFTSAALKADIALEPVFPGDDVSPTPTFMPVCTAPACSPDQGALACGDPNGCPGGCGTICLLFTPTP